jgi:cbb3-type cytochrome oxidase cytochrome c subunit
VANVTADLNRQCGAVGVPYSDDMVENAEADLMAQADPDADGPGSRSAIRRPSSAISTAIRQW